MKKITLSMFFLIAALYRKPTLKAQTDAAQLTQYRKVKVGRIGYFLPGSG